MMFKSDVAKQAINSRSGKPISPKVSRLINLLFSTFSLILHIKYSTAIKMKSLETSLSEILIVNHVVDCKLF